MRLNLCVLLTGVLLFSVPALAGTVTANNNQVSWQSTQCATPPAAPARLNSSDRHAPAEMVNKRITAYNEYAQKVQSYMDCISNEAQADAKSLSDSIIASAQRTIDDTRKNAADLAVPLQKN